MSQDQYEALCCAGAAILRVTPETFQQALETAAYRPSEYDTSEARLAHRKAKDRIRSLPFGAGLLDAARDRLGVV